MKKPFVWLSAFGLAFAFGLAAVVIFSDPGFAYYCGYECDTNWFHSTVSGEHCQCPNGVTGHVVTKWWGYKNGVHCCPVLVYCSACPPVGEKGPWPYYDPGE